MSATGERRGVDRCFHSHFNSGKRVPNDVKKKKKTAVNGRCVDRFLQRCTKKACLYPQFFF